MGPTPMASARLRVHLVTLPLSTTGQDRGRMQSDGCEVAGGVAGVQGRALGGRGTGLTGSMYPSGSSPASLMYSK